MKKYSKIIAIVISVIALWFSWDSRNISNESKNISKDALKLSKEEVRPYLQIRPKKIDKKDVYIDISEYKEGIKILFKLEVANKGRIPAENISSKSIIEQYEQGVVDATGDNMRAQAINEIPIFLAADESMDLDLVAYRSLPSDKKDILIKNINDNKQHFIVMTTIFYSSKLDSIKKYTTITCDLSKNRAELLRSGLDQFQAEPSMGKMFYFNK